ncbi:MAG: AAA family ATPase [bacterium]|nr:AAA family ATPase [bacterium]
MSFDLDQITAKVQEKHAQIDKVYEQISKQVVGQRYMVERLIMGLLAGGHILLEGVPGLAKTTTVNALASCLRAKFKRIQFTPDLLPADLIGTQIYSPKDGDFYIKKGPVFANIVLADEINRAPAKVQSALLEAMQERQVTIGDESFKLDQPFLVLATQNPVEQEGTYPLPEAQVDRFMLKIKVGYPTKEDELEVMNKVAYGVSESIEPVLHAEDIFAMREVIDKIHVDEKINKYIIDLIFATRYPHQYGIEDLDGLIEYGASPRASIYLNKLARVYAFLQGRGYVIPNDIKSIGMDVLRHRVLVTFEAEAEEKSSEDIVERIFDSVKVP